MIIHRLNEGTNNEYQTFHVYRSNWEETGQAIKFAYERDDGVRMPNMIAIPKSQLIQGETNPVTGITRFRIKKWILKKNISDGFRIIEW
jgi:hypothetical protein